MTKWITPNWSVGVQPHEEETFWSFGLSSRIYMGKRVFVLDFGKRGLVFLPRYPKATDAHL